MSLYQIDLQHAYHLVWITAGDKWKTAFQTQYRSFEWLVMPKGLTNAPTALQWFMNDVFVDMIDLQVIVYLDNILVYSDYLTEHTSHVWEGGFVDFTLMAFSPMQTKQVPCHFLQYLGYMLSPKGLTMASNKFQLSKTGPNLAMSRTFNPSLGLPTSTVVSFTNFLKSQFHSHSSPARVSFGTSPMSAVQPLRHLKRLSCLP